MPQAAAARATNPELADKSQKEADRYTAEQEEISSLPRIRRRREERLRNYRQEFGTPSSLRLRCHNVSNQHRIGCCGRAEPAEGRVAGGPDDQHARSSVLCGWFPALFLELASPLSDSAVDIETDDELSLP